MQAKRLFRFGIYSLAGIAVLILSAFIKESEVGTSIAIGSVMIFFGAENVVNMFIEKEIKGEPVRLINQIITFILGLITVFNNSEDVLSISCIILSVWSLMREGEEIYEKVLKQGENTVVAIVNAVESVAVMVLAVILIFKPTLKNAHVHVIILGIELLIEEMWTFLDFITRKRPPKQN